MRKTLNQGFTLVEMAVVLIIIGLVMGTVFPALTASTAANQRSATQSNLRALMNATAAYVQANGCVPCPASASATGNGFGVVQNFNSVTAICGSCTSSTAVGIPPFISLGLPSSIAKDGSGHWITMRVDPALTTVPANTANCAITTSCSIFVPPYAACTSLDVSNNFCAAANLNISAKGLCAAKPKVNAIQIFQIGASTSQLAAVIFVSHGAKGYGSYIANASSLATGGLGGCRYSFPGASGSSGACPPQPTCAGLPTACSAGTTCYAQCNAAGTANFINAPSGTNYDDLMLYADRNSLVSQFGNGACQTVW